MHQPGGKHVKRFAMLLALGLGVLTVHGRAEDAGEEPEEGAVTAEAGAAEETKSLGARTWDSLVRWSDYPEESEDRWHLSGAYAYRDYTFARDALQTRSDHDDHQPWSWEDGSSEGNGSGLRIAVERGVESVSLTYVEASYDYRLELAPTERAPRSLGRHHISTDRRDLDLSFARISGTTEDLSERGRWGWRIGLRYIDLDKTDEIYEEHVGHSDSKDLHGEIEWKLLYAGYFGVWRPFEWRLKAYGALHLLFGEASGLSREGSDDELDGRIREYYEHNDSLAYGANASAGVAVDFQRLLTAAIAYGREWLYSFEATDSGTVVFPDNDDALFIDSHHAWTAYLGLTF
jgi:hypothetical protein